MNETIQIHHEDEIDLKQLWQIIIKYKKMICFLTITVLVIASIWAFVQKPIYEVKAVIEIGSYGVNNTNTLLESPQNLMKRLDVVFIDNKNVDDVSFLKKIDLVKGTQNLIEIVAIANSNEEAVQKLNLIIKDIYSRHTLILDSYLALMNAKKKNLEKQQEDMLIEKQALGEFIQQKMSNIDKILKDNPAVAAIYTMDLNTKSSQLGELKTKIYTLNNQLSDLSLTLSSNNVKSTTMIGEIITNDYPIKPKKMLIIAISFLTGIAFSIFLAFLLEFMSQKNNE